MHFKYNDVRHYGGGLTDYEITGDFPITVREFLHWLIDNNPTVVIMLKIIFDGCGDVEIVTNEFSNELSITDDYHSGKYGNTIVATKHWDGKYYLDGFWSDQLFYQLADKKILSCRVWGNLEEPLYIVNIDEEGE